MDTVRLFWNGLKVGQGRLIPCFVSFGHDHIGANDNGVPYVTFSVRGYERLPEAVRDALGVINHTDYATDYFDHDRFTVTPSHPLWRAAIAAYLRNQERTLARLAKRRLPYHDFAALSRQLERARAVADGRPEPVEDNEISAYFRAATSGGALRPFAGAAIHQLR